MGKRAPFARTMLQRMALAAIGLTIVACAGSRSTAGEPRRSLAPGGGNFGDYYRKVMSLTQERASRTRGEGLAFPRIGAHLLGRHEQFADPEVLRTLGRYSDLTVINFYPGWERRYKTSIAEVVRAIRAENPNTMIGAYHNISEVSERPNYQPLVDALYQGSVTGPYDTQDWWARTPAGERISDWPKTYNTNITHFTTPNAEGKRYPEVYADFMYREVDSKADFDLYYIDIFTQSWRNSKTDFNRDGKADPATDPEVARWKRRASAGFVRYVKQTYFPDAALMGNCTTWFNGRHFNKARIPDYPEYRGILDGALYEHVMGAGWSPSGTGKTGERINKHGSFELALAGYRFVLHYCKNDYVQFQPITLVENWKTLRYAFGMALLDNGFFAPNVTTKANKKGSHQAFPVMDEYTAGRPWTDPSSTKWLGHPAPTPLGAPPVAPYQNGVWLREFEHGLVVVNPHISKQRKGAPVERRGAVTITLPPGDWRRFSGSQDPEHNDGLPCNGRLTIEAGDAYLLVRGG